MLKVFDTYMYECLLPYINSIININYSKLITIQSTISKYK
jgi:hypothetical protein